MKEWKNEYTNDLKKKTTTTITIMYAIVYVVLSPSLIFFSGNNYIPLFFISNVTNLYLKQSWYKRQ